MTRAMALRAFRTGTLLAFVSLLSSFALADSYARIVRLSYLNGDVQMDRGQGQGFERALLNMPIVQGTRLATREGGQAEIEFEDGSSVRLAPNTAITFSDLSLASDGAKISTLVMDEGTAYIDLVRPDRDAFHLQLPRQNILLDRAVRLRVEVDQHEARLSVFKGEVEFAGPDRTVRVRKNESISLDFDDPSRYVLANVIQPGPYDAWNNDRERFRTQYSTASANLHSPVYYGVSDLSYYGSTTYVPGWGYMWRPVGVGPGWDPWGYGAWSWYPSFGWTWVSGYPWGWIPYRYGAWSYVGGYGWCWRPQGGWNRWNATPVIVTAPPGYVVPVAPPHPVGPVFPHTILVSGGQHRTPRDSDNSDVDMRSRLHSNPVGGGKASLPNNGGTSTPTGTPTFSQTTGGTTTVITNDDLARRPGFNNGAVVDRDAGNARRGNDPAMPHVNRGGSAVVVVGGSSSANTGSSKGTTFSQTTGGSTTTVVGDDSSRQRSGWRDSDDADRGPSRRGHDPGMERPSSTARSTPEYRSAPEYHSAPATPVVSHSSPSYSSGGGGGGASGGGGGGGGASVHMGGGGGGGGGGAPPSHSGGGEGGGHAKPPM